MQAQPNPSHYAIAEMERYFERFLLLTQNVDDLHQRAGSKNVVDVSIQFSVGKIIPQLVEKLKD